MYDSLRVNCHSETNVLNYLTEVKPKLNHFTGEIDHFGKLDNIPVFQSSNNIFLGTKESGFSLPKYYLGNNVQSLTLKQTQEAIEKLSDSLHLNLNDAEVNRIDLATTFIMNSPASCYITSLERIPRFHRIAYDDTTKYFNTASKILCFYDKQLESKKKHNVVPEYYQNKNLLRYELRYLKRLPTQLKCPQVKVDMLYNKNFYRQLIRNWQYEYSQIQKTRAIKMNDNIYRLNPQTVYDAILLRCVRYEFGGESEFIKMFDDLYREKKIPIHFRNRIRKKMKDISNKPTITEESDLIKELDHKVKLAVGFQLDNC